MMDNDDHMLDDSAMINVPFMMKNNGLRKTLKRKQQVLVGLL